MAKMLFLGFTVLVTSHATHFAENEIGYNDVGETFMWTCHQHTLSPTPVTNIDVAENNLSIPYHCRNGLRLCELDCNNKNLSFPRKVCVTIKGLNQGFAGRRRRQASLFLSWPSFLVSKRLGWVSGVWEREQEISKSRTAGTLTS